MCSSVTVVQHDQVLEGGRGTTVPSTSESHIAGTQAPYALPYPLSRTDGPRHSRHDLGLNVLSLPSKAQTPDLNCASWH